MPPARPARLVLLMASLLAGAGPSRADVGATLSVQTDARDRGMTYSDDRPGAQFGLAWDFDAGWYAGASLTRARFSDRSGAWLRLYAGRVFGLRPGLDGEAGLLVHRFENVSRYDFLEAYAGLLGERWNLRVYASPDYYGVHQRSLYGELNLNWLITAGFSAIGHAGLLRGMGRPNSTFGDPHGPARVDLRAGGAWKLGVSSELQLAWVAASRGGPYTWTDSTRRRTVVLQLTTAF